MSGRPCAEVAHPACAPGSVEAIAAFLLLQPEGQWFEPFTLYMCLSQRPPHLLDYAFHCHNLEHEVMMTANFGVT